MRSNKTLLMGIINITPDSFSDGGCFYKPEEALRQAERLLEDGADILDLGAESTRPKSIEISLVEEWNRLKPVLEVLQKKLPDAVISIDSNKDETIQKALDYGVSYINHTKGLASAKTLRKIAKFKVNYIAMHMHKTPLDMQNKPLVGGESLGVIEEFYVHARKVLLENGLNEEQVYLDPGIGFGKDNSANLNLIKNTLYRKNRNKIVLGISRKSFIGRLLNIEDPKERDAPSKMLELAALMAEIHAIRSHDVKTLFKMRKQLI